MKLPIPESFVWPQYAGGSIANVPATIASWLGVRFQGLPPIANQPPAGGDPIHRVVLLILDGLGWQLIPTLQNELPALFERARTVSRLTSVFPSTTVSALTSLWTGLAPAQHGLVGLRLFFPKWGALGQMLKMSPEFVGESDTLIEAGLKPEEFLTGRGFAQQLADAGVPTYSLKQRHLQGTALSLMHNRGVKEELAVYTPADMFVQMRQLLLAQANRQFFLSAYWPTVDSLMHWHGPLSDNVRAEARMLLELLKREVIAPLERAGKGGTLLCVVADHGQIDTPMAQRVFLDHHPEMTAMLMMRPAGEPRAAYLYARHGASADLLAYIRERLGKQMTAHAVEEVLDAQLLGPPAYAPESAQRLGDVVVLMRDGHVLLSDDEPGYLKRMVGRHGGLSADEMYVPWLEFEL